VGAGGGSIARWLSARVGEAGRVVATDLNADRMRLDGARNVEVRVHDIVRDALEPAAFDLVHARLVLVHLRERDDVLPKLAGALRPGGWLVLEEFTHALDPVPAPSNEVEHTFNRVQAAFVESLHAAGADTLEYPRTLIRRLSAQGLRETGGEGCTVFAHGGSAAADIYRAGLLQLGNQLVSAGTLRAEDVRTFLDALDDPQFVFTLPTLVSAWGRR
jgi:SAM-dependent methyltransferase